MNRAAEGALEALLRRDRWIVAGSLTVLTIAAWGYIFRLARLMQMPGMETSGMRMDANPLMPAMIPHMQPWSVAEFGLMLLMWLIMMIGMMTPSVAPMVLLHVRVVRLITGGRALASEWWFLGGYLVAWAAFSFAATIGQWALDRMALLTSATAMAEHGLAAGLLFVAGCYQFTVLKMACLSQCQAPLAFIQRHGGFQKSGRGALALGLRHGAYCVGCCWAFMVLLFGVGVMNVIWLAAIAAIVLLEKLIPSRLLSYGLGGALIAGAVSMAVLQ